MGGGRHEWRVIDLSSLTLYGHTVTLTDAQTARLLAGETVNYSRDQYGRQEWDCQIRLPRAPATVAARVPAAFTCPTCGGHRSTNVAGQCDDCNA